MLIFVLCLFSCARVNKDIIQNKCCLYQYLWASFCITFVGFSNNLFVCYLQVAYSYRSLNITDSSGNTFFVLGYVLGLDPLGREVTKLSYTINVPGTSNYEIFVQYMVSRSSLCVMISSCFKFRIFKLISFRDYKIWNFYLNSLKMLSIMKMLLLLLYIFNIIISTLTF